MVAASVPDNQEVLRARIIGSRAVCVEAIELGLKTYGMNNNFAHKDVKGLQYKIRSVIERDKNNIPNSKVCYFINNTEVSPSTFYFCVKNSS